MGSAARNPEQRARETIDAGLAAAGWVVQHRDEMNLSAARGVAVREFPMEGGFADYLLFVDQKPVGALEAKPEGHTLSGVERQAKQYTTGLPRGIRAPILPLPFLYLSSGSVTRFTNLLDPKPRSREVFAVHQPATLAEWITTLTLDAWVRHTATHTAAEARRPSTLRARLTTLPELRPDGLRPNQFRGVLGLERSLCEDRPKALIQMATGSGKTVLAIAAIYRLIQYGGARRVLFLVDRKTLGEQAETEFANWETPDDHRKLKELFGIVRLTSQTIPESAKIVITTVQRLYSILKGDPEFDETLEEESRFVAGAPARREPVPVVYNRAIPPEFFDVVFVDECHRSIYTVWRQVLEYFDAYLTGLTATPAKHTYAFFDQNLVMEYGHAEAVVDRVNVDYDEYRLRTRISERGSTIEASVEPIVGKRDKRTRRTRWESTEDDITYDADALDRRVVARDQIRTIVRAFRERFLPECFPERGAEVPKTLVFAKDDTHAEDVVEAFRAEFAEGNDFCEKITYKSTGSAKELIQSFRTSYYPRIAVTVDMIATGTDIRPIEVVFFLRTVRSRILFEQMKGRGSRTCDPTELRAVTPSARHKERFVIVDAVGVTETELEETGPIERCSGVPLKSLLEHVAMGGQDPELLSSLASRLARLDKACGDDQEERVRAASGGPGLGELGRGLLEALDPDRQVDRARAMSSLAPEVEPTPEQRERATETLIAEATRALRERPALRHLLVDLRRETEQTIDQVSTDELLHAGPKTDPATRARATVDSFERYLAEHKDELEALRFFYAVPARRGLTLKALKELAREIQAPPRSWTAERLWRAYELAADGKVRRAGGAHAAADLVSLVRFALHQDRELVPHAERVNGRFQRWLADQKAAGRAFTPAQLEWLTMIRDHVATSLEIEAEDFDLVPFAEHGGRSRAAQVFGGTLDALLAELNEVLAA
jgi:type I restriction enzyme R subunit